MEEGESAENNSKPEKIKSKILNIKYLFIISFNTLFSFIIKFLIIIYCYEKIRE